MCSELIITNATVLPMTEPGARAEALAVSGARIVAVGNAADVGTLAGKNTKVIDADGRIVLPGFIESHMHLFAGSQSLRFLQAGEIEGFGALKSALVDYAAKTPDDEVLVAQGVNFTVLGETRPLNRHEIDAMMPNRPVLLQSPDYHNAWANTVALEAAGLLHGAELENAEVEMGGDGLATGFLKEFAAFLPVLALRSQGGRENLGIDGIEPANFTEDERAYDKRLLREGLAHCASLGITTIMNMDGNRYQLELLSELESEDALPCRIEIPYHFTSGEPPGNLDFAEGMRRDFDSDKLWSRRIKLFMDGVLDAGTALRLDDYPGQPGERGTRLHEPDAFAEAVTEADRRGFQIAVHAIGDGAVNAVLNGYEAALAANGTEDARHRIEHIEVIARNDIERMRDLGVTASVQPPHCPGEGAFPREPTTTIIGEDNWPRAYLWRTLVRAGIPICFSSDWPVAPLSPLRGIGWAVNRKPWRQNLKDERLSIEDTLRAYTASGAYAAKCENRFGMLATGMAADVVMLSAKGEPNEVNWEDAQVDMTMMNGQITHERSC